MADFAPGAQLKSVGLLQSLSLGKIWLESWLLCAILPLCENMTSSTKLEVHNESQYCQRRTEPGQHAQKIGEVWPRGFQLRRTDRQTDILITILCTTGDNKVKSVQELLTVPVGLLYCLALVKRL